jgi:hypothetical protein
MPVPLGYVSLVEAFEQTFRALYDVEALEAAFSKAGPPAEGFSEEWGEGFEFLDPDAERAYSEARTDGEGRVRAWLASGELDYFYQDPRTGEILRGLDRESWSRKMSPPGSGFLSDEIRSSEINNATCPGPPEAEGRVVFLDVPRFKARLKQEVFASRTKPVSQPRLDAAYLDRVKQIGAAGHSSLQDDQAAMRDLFPRHKITRRQIEDVRGRLAPKEWKHPGTRKR